MRGLIVFLVLALLHLSYSLGRCVKQLAAVPTGRLAVNDFETGDLVLFSGNPLLSYLLQSSFTHVGVVLATPTQKYILHISPESVKPVLCKVTPGMTVFHRAISTPLDSRKIVEWATVNHFEYDYSAWWNYTHAFLLPFQFLFPTLPWYKTATTATTKPQKTDCSTFVQRLLLEACGCDVATPCFPNHFAANQTSRWEPMKKIYVQE